MAKGSAKDVRNAPASLRHSRRHGGAARSHGPGHSHWSTGQQASARGQQASARLALCCLRAGPTPRLTDPAPRPFNQAPAADVAASRGSRVAEGAWRGGLECGWGGLGGKWALGELNPVLQSLARGWLEVLESQGIGGANDAGKSDLPLVGDDEVLEWFPDEIGSVLPRVDGNAPGPEEPESEDDSPDDSDTDADFEGLE
ncbi:hypothetical protein ACOMHN_003542 [Nucella lapillus]